MKRRRRGIREWFFLREKYINLRLRGNHLSLGEFAEQEGISYRTLERRSFKDGWFAEIERRLEQQHLAVIEHQSAVIADLRGRSEATSKWIDGLLAGVEKGKGP